MAERKAPVEPDVGPWTKPGSDVEAALLLLRSRRRDPCAERVAWELARRRTPEERARITAAQADMMRGVIEAVLDGVGLTEEQRARGVEIAVTELRRSAGAPQEDAG